MPIVQERMIDLIIAAKAFKDQLEYIKTQIDTSVRTYSAAEQQIASILQARTALPVLEGPISILAQEAAHFRANEKANIRKRKYIQGHRLVEKDPQKNLKRPPEEDFRERTMDGATPAPNLAHTAQSFPLPADATEKELEDAEEGIPIIRNGMCYLSHCKPYPHLKL